MVTKESKKKRDHQFTLEELEDEGDPQKRVKHQGSITGDELEIDEESAAFSPKISSKNIIDSKIEGNFDDSQKEMNENEAAGRTSCPTSLLESSNIPTSQSPFIDLYGKQYSAMKKIIHGESIFITGPAGTGKSHIMNSFRKVVNLSHIKSEVYFTAPTGIAACNIAGTTIHSWSGGGLCNKPTEELYHQICKSMAAMKRWRRAKILFIDEVSMLSPRLFDNLSAVGKRIRNDTRPFGGIQLVLSGDFFQLPPVPDYTQGVDSNYRFLFQSKEFCKLISKTNNVVILDKVFRQKDGAFLDMLNEIRVGNISNRTNDALEYCALRTTQRIREQNINNEKSTVTRLFSKNEDVNRLNKNELDKLEGDLHIFVAQDDGNDKKYVQQLEQMARVPKECQLKIGSLVVCTKNIEQTLGIVNGTKGLVVGFERAAEGEEVPVVDFLVNRMGEKNRVRFTCIREKFAIEVGGVEKARRWQIPLMLAWALTVHKCQGMTLRGLRVSFRGMFEFGQAYVALSRSTDFEGLQIQNYDKRCIKAHQDVKDFYSQIKMNNNDTGRLNFKGPLSVLVDELNSRIERDIDRHKKKMNEETPWIESSKFTQNNEDEDQRDDMWHDDLNAFHNEIRKSMQELQSIQVQASVKDQFIIQNQNQNQNRKEIFEVKINRPNTNTNTNTNININDSSIYDKVPLPHTNQNQFHSFISTNKVIATTLQSSSSILPSYNKTKSDGDSSVVNERIVKKVKLTPEQLNRIQANKQKALEKQKQKREREHFIASLSNPNQEAVSELFEKLEDVKNNGSDDIFIISC
jgi:hypothetical protein